MVKEYAISIENLSTGYFPKVVSLGLDIQLRKGSVYGLAGNNGSGKSTLLNTLAGFLPIVQGDVLLKGKSIHHYSPKERAENIAFVSTEKNRVNYLTVRELVSFGRYPYSRWSMSTADNEAIDDAMHTVGIHELSGRQTAELSDGELQKAYIARALAQDTDIILLDEPTAFLDMTSRFETAKILKEIAENKNKLIIYSTHDINILLHFVHEMIVLDGESFVFGYPEDLILKGEINRIFDKPGLTFDRNLSRFRFEDSKNAVEVFIENKCSSEIECWTVSALEKAYVKGSSEQSLPKKVKISLDNGRYTWTLQDQNNIFVYNSIKELTEYFRN